MVDAKPSRPKNPALGVLATIAIFVAIIGSCAAYFLWPRGERLGDIDLRAESSKLSIDVGSGDKLNFRIDTITVATNSGYPNSSSSRTNKVQEELEASKITIASVGNDGSKASTECGAFAGKSTTGSSESESVTSSGIPLDCSLVVPKTGVYTLTATVAWVPEDVRVAILEVRREKSGK